MAEGSPWTRKWCSICQTSVMNSSMLESVADERQWQNNARGHRKAGHASAGMPEERIKHRVKFASGLLWTYAVVASYLHGSILLYYKIWEISADRDIKILLKKTIQSLVVLAWLNIKQRARHIQILHMDSFGILMNHELQRNDILQPLLILSEWIW